MEHVKFIFPTKSICSFIFLIKKIKLYGQANNNWKPAHCTQCTFYSNNSYCLIQSDWIEVHESFHLPLLGCIICQEWLHSALTQFVNHTHWIEALYLLWKFIASLSHIGNIPLHLLIYCFHAAATEREGGTEAELGETGCVQSAPQKKWRQSCPTFLNNNLKTSLRLSNSPLSWIKYVNVQQENNHLLQKEVELCWFYFT